MKELTIEGIEDYAAAHTDPVPELHQELDRVTREKTTAPGMMVGRIEGAFLRMLVHLTRARRVVELGTFTGYSGLMMAEALPDDGELITCDVSEAHAEIARSFFARSPHGKKIQLKMGPALQTLKTLQASSVDMMFIDADKTPYPDYYEEGVRIVRQGGLIVADNVLWSGNVLAPKDEDTRAIAAFNERVARDPRVDRVLLTVRDGMMLARKR